MKRFNLVVLCVLMGFLAFGCGKKSGLEGKVVDGKGQPVANVKIIAKQVQPIKGYQQFETTTNSDGTFSFGKLFPTSEYILFPWYTDWTEAPQRTLRYKANKLVARFNKEGWITEQKMKLQSGPEGETILLASPIVIQPCISSIGGKIVDRKGLALANIKIIARSVNPVPGYDEWLVTTTAPDGTFTFGKLFPHSKYIVADRSCNGKAAVELRVKTRAEQEMLVLESPIVLRFTKSKAGVITDSQTGLQWAPDPGRKMSWNQANTYAEELKLGGYDDWRLPTLSELRGLYGSWSGTRRKIDPCFRLSSWLVWSSEGSSEARYLGFVYGQTSWGDRSKSYEVARALAVRSRGDE